MLHVAGVVVTSRVSMLTFPITNSLGRSLVASRAGRVGMRGTGAALRAEADAGRAWDTDILIDRTICDPTEGRPRLRESPVAAGAR